MEYRIDYRSTETGEWSDIENLGQEMSTGLEDEETAMNTFHDLMNIFHDDGDMTHYRLVEIQPGGFELTLRENK